MTDEELGKQVRLDAKRIFKESSDPERNAALVQSILFGMIGLAQEINATEFKVSSEDITRLDKPIGDWELVVRRTKAP